MDGHRGVKVAALAGGVGAGKFLRGLVRAVPPADVTAVVNTGDDLVVNGLSVSPDLDSVTYWLAGVADRERGWGREGETFRGFEELRARDPAGAWFMLGDLDLAVHQMRTRLLAEGWPLSRITAAIAEAFDVRTRVVPMSDDPVTTRIVTVDGDDLHFQDYWVRRGARDDVASIRYDGAERAEPAPGVLEALTEADAVVVCPSNPVASIGPILAVPRVRDALVERRASVVGVSPIVAGAPLRGMADRLMPAVGAEVSAFGAAELYGDAIGAWVIDDRDEELAPKIEGLGLKVAVTDTIMVDDDAAGRLARIALELVA